jgi:hypothetical protein
MATETTAPKKKGRPPSGRPWRTKTLAVATTPEELELLRQRAEAAGFPSLGAWVRLQLGLPAVPR